MARIEHSRIPATFKVSAAQIEINPDSRTDPRIVHAYAALDRGEIKVALTRMPAASIIPGFILRDAFGTIEHVSNFDADMVPFEIERIRCGFRDPVDLHWSPHAPDGGAYICPDDEVTLAAYRQLNIEFVPCRIIRPNPTPSVEAAIWLEKRGKYLGMARLVPPVIPAYRSIIGEELSDLPGALEHMTRLCSLSRASIRAFHVEPTKIAPIHYHQTLHAVVARHERALDSVLNLIQAGRREHALAIVRMAYEAFLNFYLDWLCPQFFGPRMQALAANRLAELGNGSNSVDWKPLSNFPRLFENAAEKARLSPLGPIYHNHAYPMLSLVMHQSYFAIEAEACNFDDHKSPNPVSDAQICRWLDLITAALLARVRNDVGDHI